MADDHLTLFFPDKKVTKEFRVLASGYNAEKAYDATELKDGEAVEFHQDIGIKKVVRVVRRRREK